MKKKVDTSLRTWPSEMELRMDVSWLEARSLREPGVSSQKGEYLSGLMMYD